MKLFVFDIDDTLTKSENQHQRAYVQAMKDAGIIEINQNWREYLHHTDSFILKENYENNFSGEFDFSFIPDFEKRMTELMLELPEVKEVPGAAAMVQHLSSHSDYAISFATGSLLKPALIKLRQAGIDFDEQLVVGSNAIYEREGIVSEAIQRAKEFHKVESFESIISVGDGIWDLKTAKNLGVHFIGIGMKNYQDFENEKVKMHIKDWIDFNLAEVERRFLPI